MNLRKLELSDEEIWWLSRLMQSAERAINEDHPLMLEQDDLTHIQDIIRQIDGINTPDSVKHTWVAKKADAKRFSGSKEG
ncbi:MAG TPA: hypothetical protein VH500_13575 [Nitrososphaeraceae archaeon]|jgi:hypothetical protein